MLEDNKTIEEEIEICKFFITLDDKSLLEFLKFEKENLKEKGFSSKEIHNLIITNFKRTYQYARTINDEESFSRFNLLATAMQFSNPIEEASFKNKII